MVAFKGGREGGWHAKRAERYPPGIKYTVFFTVYNIIIVIYYRLLSACISNQCILSTQWYYCHFLIITQYI